MALTVPYFHRVVDQGMAGVGSDFHWSQDIFLYGFVSHFHNHLNNSSIQTNESLKYVIKEK